MPETMPPSMADALQRMWVRFLPEIESRLAVVEGAATALEASSLPADQREAAHQAAHKLAGILGTFGLPRGTDLARQAEHFLAEARPTETASELSGWLAELRALIQSRAT